MSQSHEQAPGDSEKQAGVLQSMESHRIRHDLVNGQQPLGEAAFCSLLVV